MTSDNTGVWYIAAEACRMYAADVDGSKATPSPDPPFPSFWSGQSFKESAFHVSLGLRLYNSNSTASSSSPGTDVDGFAAL